MLSNNRVLDRLLSIDRTAIEPHLRRREIDGEGVPLGDADQVGPVLFPIDAVVAQVHRFNDDPQAVEVATVGREGFVGVPLVLGDRQSHADWVVRQAGDALQLDHELFVGLLAHHAKMKVVCDRYVRFFLTHISQRAACRHAHSVRQRISQKILVWDDRNGHRSFPMTHQTLADMVGVQRSTASSSAARLQSLGLIQYVHGRMTVVDREGLQARSCGCYDSTREHYRRLLGTE